MEPVVGSTWARNEPMFLRWSSRNQSRVALDPIPFPPLAVGYPDHASSLTALAPTQAPVECGRAGDRDLVRRAGADVQPSVGEAAARHSGHLADNPHR